MAKKNDTVAEEEILNEEVVEDVQEDACADFKQQAEESEGKYRRALADYQNLQKRVQEERLALIQAANKELLLRLLPVLDTLELANKHVQDEGLRVSISQFLDTLKAEGVTRIETVGKEFDPMFMEAVTTGEGQEGKILEELRPGYVLYDKILRPAQVIVGSAKQN